MTPIFHADTPPNMRRGGGIGQGGLKQVTHTSRPFGQDLIRMPVRRQHDINDFTNIIIRNIGQKQVAHGVDEDHTGARPKKRLAQLLGDEPQVETLFVGMPGDPAKPLGERGGIATLATWRNLDAPA